MALALARSMKGLRIALIDRRPFTVPRDQRSWALAAGVKRIFVELEVWTGMAIGAEPVKQMKITDSGKGDISRPLFLHFEGDVAPGEPFAHLVPNGLVIEQLLNALPPEVEIVAPAEITGFAAEPGTARLVLRRWPRDLRPAGHRRRRRPVLAAPARRHRHHQPRLPPDRAGRDHRARAAA